MRTTRIHISYQLGTDNKYDNRLIEIDRELDSMKSEDPRRLALFKEQDEIVELRKHDKTHVYKKDINFLGDVSAKDIVANKDNSELLEEMDEDMVLEWLEEKLLYRI